MWKIRKRKLTDAPQPNVAELFDTAHRTVLRGMLHAAAAITKYQGMLADAKPSCSDAQWATFGPFLNLTLSPPLAELVRYAEQHACITADEAQRVLAGTALTI